MSYKLINYINENYSFRDEYKLIFNRDLPHGKCFCPFHDNTNTPAAKVYDNNLYCFSCKKSYGVYDLLKRFNPSKIDEIKASVVVPDVERVNLQKLGFVSIDRNLPINEVIKQILNGI